MIQPTAVDIDANTFTATAHGLVNGDIIFPAMNNVIDIRVAYPGGVTQLNYYVVGATANTFQISTTSGGAALDVTSAANLSSMHFQKALIKSLSLSNIGTLKRCRVRAFVTSSIDDKSQGVTLIPGQWPLLNNLSPNPVAAAKYSIGRVGAKGTTVELIFDGVGRRVTAMGFYVSLYGDNTTANGAENRIGVMAANETNPFTSLLLEFYNTSTIYIANGTRIEVYSA